MSSRRVPDPGSLIAGVTFAGIGLIFLVGNVELADRARWVWPIVLVGLGAGLLAAVLRRAAEPDAEDPAAGTASTFWPAEHPDAMPPDEPEAGVAEEPGLAGDTEIERGLAGDTELEPGLTKDAPADEVPRGRAGS
jgi:hypothetical protein